MVASSFKYALLSCMLAIISIVIVLLPFHAFLTIWLSTGIDHYTALRLWKEVLIFVASIGALYLLAFDRKVRMHTLSRKLTWLILAYIALLAVVGLGSMLAGEVTPLAAAYGILLDGRFLVFFLLAWAVAVRTDRLERRWPKLLLWPAFVVVVIGLLQVFVLPPYVLKHFGYGPSTIEAVSTINENDNFLRYMSTLRGANPLGAYLLLPISVLTVLLLKYPRSWNWARGLLLIGCLAMLVFSFSRSAWIGAVLTIMTAAIIARGAYVWHKFRTPLAGALVVLVVAVIAAAVTLQNNAAFQNFIFHTEDNSQVATSSNGVRLQAITDGASDIVRDPLGDGPGTAGPASVYNDNRGRISENYYLQVGQEIGIVGLGLFAIITIVIGYILWNRRQSPLALALLASLIGITAVNLLSHAWTDDTLAYIWWGLAGIAVAKPVAYNHTESTSIIE